MLRVGLLLCLIVPTTGFTQDQQLLQNLLIPKRWVCSPPLVSPEQREVNASHAQKDPTIVFHDGKWHLFMTVKLDGRSVMEYCSFATWDEANDSERTLLEVSDRDYFCAPQVFYFEPHKLWYLVYQVGVPGQNKMWVAYSTTKDISDPHSWTKAKPMLDGGPTDPRDKGGLDYWIICNDTSAFLFITTNNRKMWRLETPLDQFPYGWGNYALALQGKIFEASHTYKIQGYDKYLTIIEERGKRYFKAYIADRLDGEWKPLADTYDHPFAADSNVTFADGVKPWTDNISHGELIRASNDQRLIIDPQNMQFLFQGMWEKDKANKNYGQFPWRLGLLKPASEN